MATSLLKLTMTASKPTTTAKPTATNFFNTAPTGGYTGSATYTINDINWVDDSGTAVAAGGLVPASTNNGYYALFINGQLQEDGVITSVTTTAVTITFGAETTIEEGKIISLAVINFDPDTSAPVISG